MRFVSHRSTSEFVVKVVCHGVGATLQRTQKLCSRFSTVQPWVSICTSEIYWGRSVA